MSVEPQVAAVHTTADPSAATVPDLHEARMPRTRTGMVWFGLCAGAVAFLVLVVFMAQNTRSTEVSFLWLHGTLPLALALLIASVGAGLLTMVVDAARITQLRRLSRRQR
jgi:uncharacterized integral membrane protein